MGGALKLFMKGQGLPSVSLAAPPGIALTHLQTLTDDTGLIQHARYAIPDRRHGYCLDDNARALALTARLPPAPEVFALASIYASFLDHAWDREPLGGRGRFENFMSYDREWLPDGGTVEDEDAQARGVHALALVALSDRPDAMRAWAGSLLIEAIRPPALPLALGSPRAWAISVCTCRLLCCSTNTMSFALGARDHARTVGPQLAQRLLELHRRGASVEWPWFEASLAYDNARLCEGALAGSFFDPALREIGLETLNWLCANQTAPDGHFRPFGNTGFGKPGVVDAPFDQQPIEAWATIDAAALAYELTGDPKWLSEAERAFAWFTGANDANHTLIDSDGGCADGIQPNGLNANRGAESTLAWLHAAVAMRDLRSDRLAKD